jgi:triacylglycerol lipase
LLVHGLLGFGTVSGLSYFNGVRNYFDAGCQFIEPQLDPLGTIDQRAKVLMEAIQNCVPAADLDRGKALHIVAHSMGGLDARYLVSKNGLNRGSWIASITLISTPNAGSRIADIVTRQKPIVKLPTFNPASLLFPTSNTRAQLSGYIAAAFGSPADAFKNLTTSFCDDFNMKYPDCGSLPVQSYTGISTPNETMTPILYVPWAILKSQFGDNDGLVPISSSKVNGAGIPVAADHIEEVGLAYYVDFSLGTQKHFPIQNIYRPINQQQALIGDHAPLSPLLKSCNSL